MYALHGSGWEHAEIHHGRGEMHGNVDTNKAPEQTIPLSETTGMLRRIATIEIEYAGRYFCMLEGRRTEVVSDDVPPFSHEA